MINLLLGPVASIVKDAVGGYVENKKAKSVQKLTEIKAKTSLMEKQINGERNFRAKQGTHLLYMQIESLPPMVLLISSSVKFSTFTPLTVVSTLPFGI